MVYIEFYIYFTQVKTTKQIGNIVFYSRWVFYWKFNINNMQVSIIIQCRLVPFSKTFLFSFYSC